MRARGDGSLPVDGWSGDAEWTGWIPFEELPHLYDPPEHFIVTANNRPAARGYPYTFGVDWPEPFRATRITELLRGRTNADAGRLRADPGRHRVAPCEGAAAAAARSMRVRTSAAGKQALDMLRRWDGDVSAGSARRGDLRGVVSAADAEASPATSSDPLATDSVRRPIQVRHPVPHEHADRERRRRGATMCRPARAETCDDAVTAALQRGGRGSRGASRRRHGRAGAGTPSTARSFRIRDSTRSLRCAGSSAARCRTAATGAPSTSARFRPVGRTTSARSPATARSSTSRPPTTAASSSTSGSRAIPCRSTTTIFSRIGRRCDIGGCAWSGPRSSTARSGRLRLDAERRLKSLRTRELVSFVVAPRAA